MTTTQKFSWDGEIVIHTHIKIKMMCDIFMKIYLKLANSTQLEQKTNSMWLDQNQVSELRFNCEHFYRTRREKEVPRCTTTLTVQSKWGRVGRPNPKQIHRLEDSLNGKKSLEVVTEETNL